MKDKAYEILIVDDEKDLREMLLAALEFFGYKGLTAENGAVAWKMLNSGVNPDLVITDINMPEMDGRELLRRINDKFPNLPVIVITAYGAVKTADKLQVAGADDYIEKPFSLDRLSKSIEKIFNRK